MKIKSILSLSFLFFTSLICAQITAQDEDTGGYTTCNSDGANATRTSNDLSPRANVGTIDDRSCYANYKETTINGTTWGIYNITDGSNNQDAANTLQPRIERSLARSQKTGVGSYAEFKGTVRILEVGKTNNINDDGTYIMQAKGKHTGGGGSPDPAICLYLAKPVYDASGTNQISFNIYREQINFRGGSGASGRSIIFLKNIGKNIATSIELKVGFRQDPNDVTKKIHYADAIIGGTVFNWNIPEPEKGTQSGIRYGAYRVKGGRAQIRWANTTYSREEREDVPFTPIAQTITSAKSGNWNTTTTWVGNTIPTNLDNVIIDHGVTIAPNMSASAKSITLNSGGGAKRLNIQEGSNLTVSGDIVLNRSQDGLFFSYSNNPTTKDLGTLIFTGSETENKRIYIKKRLPSNNDWHLISSSGNTSRQNEIAKPTNSNIVINTTKNIYSIASYNGNNSKGLKYEYLSANVAYANNVSFAKSGYAIKVDNKANSNEPDIVLRPKLNATDITEDISDAGDGYNLLGNPYLNYLHVNTAANATNNLLAINKNVLEEQTIWVWNNAKSGGAGWETYNLGSLNYRIHPVQGFFVKAKSGGLQTESFLFTEAMQTHTKSGQFYKSNNRFQIDLSIESNALKRISSIKYINGVTTSFDNGYDSSLFSGSTSNLEIYTGLVAGNFEKKLAIQSLPNQDYDNMVIPVGVTANANSEITFAANSLNLPTGFKVFLEDRANNTFNRLDKANATYTTTIKEQSTEGRFFLHTKNKAVLSVNANFLNSVNVYKTTNSNLKITGLQQGQVRFTLYNILGKQITAADFKVINSFQNIALPVLSKGVYLIQLETENGKLNQKIIIE
ncbi:T9SS type A sorting domain-containing protein [uncultured Polaribacter sp.]|uniref:T9SS type A sorting domain-containing protein n=1 Tax=uncultured Polaribacter sp. TaxID=174711 RepID=UPI002611C6C1|nr:T9SS type A sorting domain-containing protein [uncultured Polaribacter sp.]